MSARRREPERNEPSVVAVHEFVQLLAGWVPDEELAIYYRHAAVYVSLSEHEGS